MKTNKKWFLIGALLYAIFFLGVDLKNLNSNGAFFIVNEDFMDKLKFYSELPGFIPSFVLILIIYQNIHNYDSYVLESFMLLFNSIIYGLIAWYIKNKINSWRIKNHIP